jgi:catechol 2,3-dioxygenase-like lactoylglutathione lyase family enzyme
MAFDGPFSDLPRHRILGHHTYEERGMTMILGTFHTCINVRDMDESLDFYCGILGMTISKEMILSGKGMDETVGLENVIASMIWLNAGDGPQVELLHFIHPEGKKYDLKDNDIGIAHICFEVEDVKETYHYLVERGVHVIRPPESPVVGGELDGYFSFHILDPNGVNLEIKQR